MSRRAPLREHVWGMLILALYRCGRQGDARRAYARARHVLAQELGVDPGFELRRIEADVLAQSPTLMWTPPPASAAGVTLTVPGPHASTTFATGEVAPIVGRTAPLGTLREALRDATTGDGRLALVMGKPGIGKTRLAEELVDCAGNHGAIAAWGLAHEGDGVPPFWLWVQVARALCASADPGALRVALETGAAELAQVIPEVKEIVGKVSPLPPTDPATAQFRFYDATARFLARLTARRDRRSHVVLDDLHWADVASLRLTQFVTERLDGLRMLLLATYRDVDPVPGDRLTQTLGELARVPRLVRLKLAGLSQPEVALFLAQASGRAPDPGLATAVWSGTDGNPFFVGELARLVAAEGTWAKLPGGRLPVPPGVRDVIRRRLARLPEATRPSPAGVTGEAGWPTAVLVAATALVVAVGAGCALTWGRARLGA